MNPLKMLLATSVSVILAGSASPAFAQRHGDGGGNRGGGVSRGQAHTRAVPRSPAVVSRIPAVAPRGYAVRGGPFVAGRVAVPRYSIVAPVRFYRPYYTFRPRLNLGFGLWVGYPFAYSYGFYDPFYYPYGYVNPYAYPPYGYPAYPPPPSYPVPSSAPSSAYPPYQQDPQGSVDVQPEQADSGGLSFQITPDNAQLFVDGRMVGTVGQFTPTSQPLGLPAGRHHVEVRSPGYDTMSFDVDIIAGQVIPYRGAMERR